MLPTCSPLGVVGVDSVSVFSSLIIVFRLCPQVADFGRSHKDCAAAFEALAARACQVLPRPSISRMSESVVVIQTTFAGSLRFRRILRIARR